MMIDWYDSPLAQLDVEALGQGSGFVDAADAIRVWLGDLAEEESGSASVLEMRRSLLREWRPGHGGPAAVMWLHAVRDPGPSNLCSDVAGALESVLRSLKSDRVEDYLRERGRLILAKVAADVSTDHRGLRNFLKDAPLKIEVMDTEYWPGLLLPTELVVAAHADAAFGLSELRERLGSATSGFDAYIDLNSHRYIDGLLAELSDVATRSEWTAELRNLVNHFPLLNGDPRSLSILVAALERSVILERSPERVTHEGALLDAVAATRCWTSEHLGRLSQLDGASMSANVSFQDAAVAGIRANWTVRCPSSVHAALCVQRLRRIAASGKRNAEDLERNDQFLFAVNELDGGKELIWLLERMSELSYDIAGERVAWSYLADAAKGHWCWLVYSRLSARPEFVEGFVRFVMEWLPRETYGEVELLLAELARDANQWDTIDALANGSGGASMLRAGSLARRRKLRRLPSAYYCLDGEGAPAAT